MASIELMRAGIGRTWGPGSGHGVKWRGKKGGRVRVRVRVRRVVCAQGKEVVVGIDLGTTNSAISIVKDGSAIVVPNSEGQEVTPSVVSFQRDGAVAVGVEAKKLAHNSPETTFFSVKRLIGRRYSDVENEIGQLPYAVKEGPSGNILLENPFVEQGFVSPEEISSIILQKMLSSVEKITNSSVKKAVISVPAYFNRSQQEATKAAGELAGLEKVRLIKEPVASALGYGVDIKEDQTILVFDLGGGTLDVSILEVGGGVIEVLATGGDAHLGGDDWDSVIVGWLVKEHLGPAGVNWKDPKVMYNLKSLAEYAKIKLSSGRQVALKIPLGPGFRTVLTQQLLEQLSKDLFIRARKALDYCCLQAGIEPVVITKSTNQKDAAVFQPKMRDPVSEVLLVGGATRMPVVHHFVENMTGLKPKAAIVDPDKAVALGAAVQAGMLQGEVEDVMMMDVFQASLMRAFATKHVKSMEGGNEVK